MGYLDAKPHNVRGGRVPELGRDVVIDMGDYEYEGTVRLLLSQQFSCDSPDTDVAELFMYTCKWRYADND